MLNILILKIYLWKTVSATEKKKKKGNAPFSQDCDDALFVFLKWECKIYICGTLIHCSNKPDYDGFHC